MKALSPTSRVSSLSPDKAAASREVFGSPSGCRAAGTPAQVSPTHRGRSRAAGGTQQGGCSLRKGLSLSWRGQELPEKSSSLGAAWLCLLPPWEAAALFVPQVEKQRPGLGQRQLHLSQMLRLAASSCL